VSTRRVLLPATEPVHGPVERVTSALLRRRAHRGDGPAVARRVPSSPGRRLRRGAPSPVQPPLGDPRLWEREP
jgi:hypothetical protein